MGFDFLEMEFLRNGNTPATWSVEVEQLAQRVTLLEWRKGDQAQGRTEEKKKACRAGAMSVSPALLCKHEVLGLNSTDVEAFVRIPSTEGAEIAQSRGFLPNLSSRIGELLVH